MLIGFASGRFASPAAVATDDGTSGADGTLESIGESNTGADAGADEAATDATADDGAGATDGATAALGEPEVPHPATNTAASAATAVPTAMCTLGRAPAGRAPAARALAGVFAFAFDIAFDVTDAFTVDGGDGARASTHSR